MAFDVTNPYFRNQVLTASPEKLRLLLLDGCVHFIEEGIGGIEAKDTEKMYSGLSQAKDIVIELMSSMRPEIDADLCAKVGSLYTFVFKHLTEAGFERDAGKARECLQIMQYERETWSLLMEKAAKEGAGSGASKPSMPAPSAPKAPQVPQGPSRSMPATYGPPKGRGQGPLSISA